MEVSNLNEHGIVATGHREIVASYGRSVAAIEVALCEDGFYRYSVELFYSYGGYCGPIRIESEGCATLVDAINAGIGQLLDRWPGPFPSDPASVQTELRALRDQLENRLRQPTLF